LPLQHPLGHDAASHTHLPVAALHSWPEAQAKQLTPPLPQVVAVSVWTQCPVPSQQPLGHVVASQTHFPWALHS